MNTLGIILISHGEFARAALDSAQMIAGPQEDVIALALTVSKSLDEFEKEIADSYNQLILNHQDIIVLCDIYGGTPFNALSRCMLKGMSMIGFTGLNLPVLIDLLLSRELSGEEAKVKIMETHAIACMPVNVTFVEDDDDISDL